jgi:chromosome segregation ATPase
MKAATIIFVILTIALGAALFVRHTNAIKERQVLETQLAKTQRDLEEKSTKLDDQERISLILQTNLSLTSQELQNLSNHYVKVSADLRRTQADAKASAEAAKASEEAAKVEMAKKETQINELQVQGDELSKKIDGLESALGDLNKQISDTEAKLAAAEGDREFLLKELKRLQVEKSDLERQFNDLALLRTQISKLKEELSISRRLEWIRTGIYGSAANKKGAELLMSGITPPQAQSNFNLNVELRQDSGAAIVSPQTNTNAPPNP